MDIRKGTIDDSVVIDSLCPGPKLLLMAGVHGNETSGLNAVEKLLFDFMSGSRKLDEGTLTIVRANREAITVCNRLMKHNLNRLFRDEYGPEIDRACYEFRRAQEIKPYIREAEYILDLHSTSSPSEPHIVVESDRVGWYRDLGVSKLLTGWSKVSGGVTDGTTESYAKQHGRVAATLEAGSHADRKSIRVAYRTAVRFLMQHRLTGATCLDDELADPRPEVYEIDRAHFKKHEEFSFLIPEVRGFLRLEPRQPYAKDGERMLCAGIDDYLLMPAGNPRIVKMGEELFFIGRRVE